MMRRILLSAVCMAVMCSVKAQEYAVSKIPEVLKEGALAVIRKQDVVYELISEKKAVYREHKVITILKKEADGLAFVYSGYNNLSRVDDIEAVVYDRFGKQVEKMKKSDIVDESFIDGFSLYSDTRLKYADMSQNTYPYTIESTLEVTYNYLYAIPKFQPQVHAKVSVEAATYTLTAPPGIYPRFREINYSGSKRESTEDGKRLIHWRLENIPVVQLESFGESLDDKTPHVLIAPGKFEYDGFDGDMSTWDSYVAWKEKLNANRNTLPDETIEKIRKMTAGKADIEKARIVYEYMQQRTRYVSIQDGIGGLQPFESGLVDEVGYGDCKALSFYTKNMLEAAGLTANYTVVSAGDDPGKFYEDFPYHYTNHVILAVPIESDTIWLECTSQTKPFGFLGSFTDDRDVVMMTDNGAGLVRTPRYDHRVNTQFRTAKVQVGEDGKADIDVLTTYSGIQYENGDLDRYLHLGRDKQEKWVHDNTDIPSYELLDFNIENRPDRIPRAKVSLKLHVKKLTSVSGKRVFLTPNLMNQVENFLPNMDERKDPVFIRTGSYDIDTVIYEFPSNLRAEYIPDVAEMESDFGYYHASYKFIQGKLVYIRTFKFYEGTYEPEEYESLFQFLRSVEREDKKKVVLLRGT